MFRLTLCLMLAACAAEHVDQRNSRIGGGAGGTGGGGTGDGAGTGGPGGCGGILAQDCDPDEKPYTPQQIAECEAGRQASYDDCVVVEACNEKRAPAEKACYSPDGTKPAEGTPERAVFDACMQVVQDAWTACVGATPGGGTGGGGGGGTGGP
jgi:hypothetical protein